MREYQVRFCEGLVVKFHGPTWGPPTTAAKADDSYRALGVGGSSRFLIPLSPSSCRLAPSTEDVRRLGGEETWMTGVWALAALWLGLALVASLLSIWLRISTALSEIVIGTIAQLIIGAAIGSAVLGTDESWIRFLSGIGAIVLTFLAGAELDPASSSSNGRRRPPSGWRASFSHSWAAPPQPIISWGGR